MAKSDQSNSDLQATLFPSGIDAPPGVVLEQYKLYLQLLDKIGDSPPERELLLLEY